MKKLAIIFGLALLIISCKNNNSFAPGANEEASIDDFFESSGSSFTKTDLLEQKLQEVYDLSLLKQLHPEFEEELLNQIKSLSDGEILLTEKTDAVKINNLTLIGDVNIKSDSISEIKLYYEVSYNNKVVIDSILAIVKTHNIEIEGDNFSSTKIRFKKITD